MDGGQHRGQVRARDMQQAGMRPDRVIGIHRIELVEAHHPRTHGEAFIGLAHHCGQPVEKAIQMAAGRLAEAESVIRRVRLVIGDRRGVGAHPAATSAAAASRSRWARLFFSAAVLSWPQAASMSRPRGVRTGALMPWSKTISEKRFTRSGVEHS